jgi:hypothetical protein
MAMQKTIVGIMLGHRISRFIYFYFFFLKLSLFIQCGTEVAIWSKTLAPFPKMKLGLDP